MGRRAPKVCWLFVVCIGMLNASSISESMVVEERVEQSISTQGTPLNLARTEIPPLLARVYQALNQADPSSIRSLIDPNLARDTRRLDLICTPYRYKAHLLVGVTEIDRERVKAGVSLLTTDFQERFYVLFFHRSTAGFVLYDVRDGDRDAEEFLQSDVELAANQARKIIYALDAGMEEVALQLSTRGLVRDLVQIGGWSRLLRGKKLRGNVEVSSRVIADQGLRVAVQTSYTLEAEHIGVILEFDRIDNALKVVRISDSAGKTIAADPALSNYALARFGLSKNTPSASTASERSKDLRFASTKFLLDEGKNALNAERYQEALHYGQEAYAADPTDPDVASLLQRAHFRLRQYSEAERFAREAIRNGGAAEYVLLHHHLTEPVIHEALISIGSRDFSFNPQGKCNYAPFRVPLSELSKVELRGEPASDLFLHIEIEHQSPGERKLQRFQLNFANVGAQTRKEPGKLGPLDFDAVVIVSSQESVQALQTVMQVLKTAIQRR